MRYLVGDCLHREKTYTFLETCPLAPQSIIIFCSILDTEWSKGMSTDIGAAFERCIGQEFRSMHLRLLLTEKENHQTTYAERQDLRDLLETPPLPLRSRSSYKMISHVIFSLSLRIKYVNGHRSCSCKETRI